MCRIHIGKLELMALVDTGADTCVLLASKFQELSKSEILSFQADSDVKISGVSGHALRVEGVATIRIKIQPKTFV